MIGEANKANTAMITFIDTVPQCCVQATSAYTTIFISRCSNENYIFIKRDTLE